MLMRTVWTSALIAAFGVGVASAQSTVIPLWPKGNPEPSTITGPEFDPTAAEHHEVAGKSSLRLTNISKPSMALYPPKGHNSGAAVLVFPGGGYLRLSMELEGSEICDWLNGLGVTCLVVKYRVPQTLRFPENTEDLEDAQQAIRLTREHAKEWGIDPHKVGVIGFSAGAHLAVMASTHSDYKGVNVASSTVNARPDFQMVMYPGYLNGPDGKIAKTAIPTPDVPPTFLVMAENDYTAHVENALIYFQALKDAKIPAEMHLYTQGGHGFGMRDAGFPITGWPRVAELWLHTIHVLGPAGVVGRP